MIRPRTSILSLQREAQEYNSRDEILRLDMNEYVPYADEGLYKELIKQIRFDTISGYPLVNNAYYAIAEFLNQPVDKIVLTAGSDGVIFSTLMAFCDNGDNVGYIEPAYGMYAIYCDMLGLNKYSLSFDESFNIDENKLLQILDLDLKVFIFANPNGVIGSMLNADLIEKIVRKANNRGTVVLIDEVHADFLDKGYSRYAYLTELYDNLVIARSFSKSYGLAGIRAGYAFTNSNTRKYLISVRSNVEISSIAGLAIQVWCKNKKAMSRSIDEINESKAMICTLFQEYGVEAIDGKGNFIIIKPPTLKYGQFKHIMEKNRIKVKYLSGAFSGWIRITVGTKEYMQKLVEIIKKEYRL